MSGIGADAPFIGWSSDNKDDAYLVATGFAAWGFTNGAAAGILIADLVEGRDNPWSKLSGEDLAEPKACKGGDEMALERAPLLLRVSDRSPHDDPVGAALFNVDDVHRAILSGPLRARLDRGGLEVRIARAQRPPDLRGQFCRYQRGLHSAAAQCRGREHN